MATLATIPVAEYLATSYEPDREYIDGELLERNLGETLHGKLQAFFILALERNMDVWGLESFPETRVQVSATRFRIPDVCAIGQDDKFGRVLINPPVVCVEILSPGDTLAKLHDKRNDYVTMGIKNIWVVDPARREFWTADAAGFHPVQGDAFTIAGTPVRIELAEINAVIDRMLRRMR